MSSPSGPELVHLAFAAVRLMEPEVEAQPERFPDIWDEEQFLLRHAAITIQSYFEDYLADRDDAEEPFPLTAKFVADFTLETLITLKQMEGEAERPMSSSPYGALH